VSAHEIALIMPLDVIGSLLALFQEAPSWTALIDR
jgi:hypothetical protein